MLKLILLNVGEALLSKLGKTVLYSLGLGLVTSTITLTLLNKYIAYALSSYSSLGKVVGILGIAGFNVAFSIIFSALVIRMTITSKMVQLRAKS